MSERTAVQLSLAVGAFVLRLRPNAGADCHKVRHKGSSQVSKTRLVYTVLLCPFQDVLAAFDRTKQVSPVNMLRWMSTLVECSQVRISREQILSGYNIDSITVNYPVRETVGLCELLGCTVFIVHFSTRVESGPLHV